MLRRPVPVQHIFAILIPTPLHFAPKLINLCSQCLFFFASIFKVFAHREKALNQKCGFNQVTSIIFRTEWFCFSRLSVQPMWPCTMKTFSCVEVMNDVIESFKTLLAGNEASLNANE